MSTAALTVRAGGAVLLAAAAGLLVAPAFGGSARFGTAAGFAPGALMLVAVAPAVVAGAAVALLVARRLDTVVAGVAGLILGAVVVGVIVRPGRDVVSGPYRLLTAALPLPARGAPLAAVGAVVVLVTVAGVLLATTTRRPVFAVLPGLLAVGAALALDAGAAQPVTAWAVPVLVAVAAVVAAGRVRAWRIGLGAVAVVAVAAIAAVLLTPVLPGGHNRPAADLRHVVSAPIRPRTLDSPLQLFAALRTGALRVAAAGTSDQHVSLLRLATLPNYDGRYWTPAPSYRRAGTRLPASLHEPGRPDTVTARIDVSAAGDLAGVLSPGVATRVSVDGLAVDSTTGDVVVPAGQNYPSDYRITAEPVADDISSLQGAALSPLDGAAINGQVDVPADVSAFVNRFRGTPSGAAALGVLRTLTQAGWVRDDAPDAPGGHSLAQIATLLTGQDGRHLGTGEQYASAYAVILRLLGYTARVVMGFAPEYRDADAAAFAVRGTDVRAWDEVRLADGQWMTVDPTPTATTNTPRPSTAPSPTPVPISSSPSGGAGGGSHGAGTTPSGRAQAAPATHTSPLPAEIAVAALVVLLLLLLPGGAKTWRRRRRRGASSTGRAVAGAWQDSLDRLTERGVRLDRTTTTAEVVQRSPGAVEAPLRRLGAQWDRSAFAPEDPPPDAPGEAWRSADTVRRHVWDGRPRWRRALAWLDPRPLWRQ